MNEKSKNRLSVTSSPHLLCRRTTRGIMLDVIVALLPAALMSSALFGYRSALVIGVCVASCGLFEAAWCLFMKKPLALKDLSFVVTGLLLAFNLPPGIPLWQAVLGSAVAIIVVKQLFGGLGCNFVNPALAARIILALSFTASMTAFPAFDGGLGLLPAVGPLDALSSATPLTAIQAGESPPRLLRLFLGHHGGALGETCAAALLAGGLYLVIRRVITPHIPLAFIGSALLFSFIFGHPFPLHSMLSGGLMLGAIFMATDYVTSPYTSAGKLIFGLGCGLLTALIRTFGNSSEGVSYALLLMNILVPYINELVRRKPYGTGGTKQNA